MVSGGISVAYLSGGHIERTAKLVHQALRVPSHGRIPINWLLEHGLDLIFEDAYFDIEFDSKLGGAEARTSYHEPLIVVSQTTYDKLERGDPRARMTIAHEVGHLLLHCRRPITMNKSARYDRHTDPEWQADLFAAALLMPKEAFKKMKSVDEAMRTFGVSRSAAITRAKWLHQPLAGIPEIPERKKKATPKRRH